ncbi:MAG: hypothetical protein QXK83_06620 [Zestosphaera sp.]
MLKVGVFDFASKYVVPAIKKMLIGILYREYGFTQLTISRMLGVSQSSVSKNVSKYKLLATELGGLSSVEATVRRLAEGLVNGDLRVKDLELAIDVLALELLREGHLCKYHSLISEDIKLDSCNLCRELFRANVLGGGDASV